MAGFLDFFGRRNAKQGKSSTIRDHALAEIRKTWSVDVTDVTPHEHGFDWLPGSHTVRVRMWKDIETPGAERWRLMVTTDLLRELPPPDTMFVRNANHLASVLCPTYSVIYPPRPILKQHYKGEPGNMEFFASAYLYEHLGTEWLPAFFARMAILQPICAESWSIDLPDNIGGGRPAFAQRGKRKIVSNALNVQRDLIIPEGRLPSRWTGSPEFEAYANTYGRDDECFATADAQGLALQVPFGSQSATIVFQTNNAKLELGSGLLISIGTTSYENFDEACARAAELNFLESVAWTEFPQLGCWHAYPVADEGVYVIHTCFIPNAFFAEGLVRHLADWSRARVKQARRGLLPNARDLPIGEILKH